MLTWKRSGVGSASFGLLVASFIASSSVFAVDNNDISVQGTARASNVRSTVRTRPSPTPTPSFRPQSAAPRAAMPRPIQDETTRVPNPPQAVPARNSVQQVQQFQQPQQPVQQRQQVQQQQPRSTNFNLAPQAATSAPVARRPAPRGNDQAVDLDTLTGTPTAVNAGTPKSSSMSAMNPHGPQPGQIMPNLKFYYDFLLKSWKGGGASQGSLTFDNYHQKMMVEYSPNQDFTFAAEILERSYYEVDYAVSPKFQLRWGKIWIPFDDMSPHNIFGGRINTSRFLQVSTTGTTEQQFLPDIWADLGVAGKWTLADSSSFSSVLHLYIVNGFGDGGTSPVAGEAAGGIKYPNFASAGAGPDNNNNKAIGGRWALGFGPKFGMGFSYYTGSYTGKGVDPDNAQGITIMGGDMQIRPTNTTEFRLGLTSMKVGLMSPAVKQNFTRGGSYVELGQRFGLDNRWKFLVRAGKSQNDNRVVDVSDKTLVGFTLLRNFRVFEAQLTFYKDLNKVEGKTAYNYAALRLVTAF